MKKTLIALTVAALASTSASAFKAYSNEGTEVNVSGDIKFAVLKEQTKVNGVKTVHGRTDVDYKGASLKVNAKHTFGDLYAVGQYKFGVDYGSGVNETKEAFLGLGTTSGHLVTVGKQPTFMDEAGKAGHDNIFGLTAKYGKTSGAKVLAYRFTGVEGLTVGADYAFAESRGNDREVNANFKNAFDMGVAYEQGPLSAVVNLGHENFKPVTVNGVSAKHNKTSFNASVAYEVVDGVTLAGDMGYSVEKNTVASHLIYTPWTLLPKLHSHFAKTKAFYFTPGVEAKVADAVSVYGNLHYEVAKTTFDVFQNKTKTVGINLGAKYSFTDNVSAFVETQLSKAKYTRNYGSFRERTTKNRAIGVGMKVEW